MNDFISTVTLAVTSHEIIFPRISFRFTTNPFRFGNSHSDSLFLRTRVQIAYVDNVGVAYKTGPESYYTLPVALGGKI